jgi:S-adenosylmethionine hydrolase
LTKHIAIFTDFGLEDTYLGMMKAVISGISPEARIIDLTHAIPAGDIQRGAFEAWRVRSFLPQGSILLGVVDPGVGTERNAVAIKLPDLYCVGPDNGLFSYLFRSTDKFEATALLNPRYHLHPTSQTFHGRDIFAPAAAYLTQDLPMAELGPVVPGLVRLPDPLLIESETGSIRGEIMDCDHFGNLITSVGTFEAAGDRISLTPWVPTLSARTISTRDFEVVLPRGDVVTLGGTFGDVPQGEALAFIGSSGLLEIAINGGSAAEVLGLSRGDEIFFTNKG